ncbi:hypothetical protein CDG76_21885 [Nostoc sp. 'Peltigera membranacea cyanobiont' 210A]|uniref:hypothetical protein n=1 Tax=Nostoc sp. 'Peltigera membranacea cyanobiont' 210A TaxID=2014529 RepID=UPI000B959837|nr:hypothetical protein [Nostoc sp. 'Peltigera membranacea cyanobiont' 210A]OYD93321.1 hypothetical protein CDG76_21885 [Nostoc sp. 'Peltigera membranacea cyanobiont' 210A]
MDIAREIGDRNSEAIAWFNLGEALENLNRELDTLGAYRNARKLTFSGDGTQCRITALQQLLNELLNDNRFKK